MHWHLAQYDVALGFFKYADLFSFFKLCRSWMLADIMQQERGCMLISDILQYVAFVVI